MNSSFSFLGRKYQMLAEMNSVFGLKTPDWDLNKSQYAEIDSLPLMPSIGPILTIVAAYLVFVLKVGPSYMRKREPFKLWSAMLVYNAVQVAISVYLVFRYGSDLLNMGLFPKKCPMDQDNQRSRILFGIYIYFSAKVTELLDTVFFVIRKKTNQITFLHLYHHTIMVVATWALLKYAPTHNLIFTGFLNSLVHVFMYTYYGLSALGPNVAKYLTWKKYMTMFQLIQFISIIVQFLITNKISECPPSTGLTIFYTGNTTVILLLFVNFYVRSYVSKRKSKTCSEIPFSESKSKALKVE